MNSKNGKAVDPHRLILNLSDKVNIKMSDKLLLLYQILVSIMHRKI